MMDARISVDIVQPSKMKVAKFAYSELLCCQEQAWTQLIIQVIWSTMVEQYKHATSGTVRLQRTICYCGFCYKFLFVAKWKALSSLYKMPAVSLALDQ